MKQTVIILLLCMAISCTNTNTNTQDKPSQNTTTATQATSPKKGGLKLGAFSVSLNVKNLAVSKEFYEKLGFKISGGDMKKNYLIMKNENSIIGLFQGMFEKNILTFNPGWDENTNPVKPFDDVREIQRQLKAKGLKMETEADERTSGPASLIILDPDGNQILLDQHL